MLNDQQIKQKSAGFKLPSSSFIKNQAGMSLQEKGGYAKSADTRSETFAG